MIEIDPGEAASFAIEADLSPALWPRLARAVAIDPEEPVCVALSGGADSVYLLHAIAAAERRPPILAIHVDHALRGAESDADALSCEVACRALDVELVVARVELDRTSSGLEARARAVRYAALADAARAKGIATIATAHHADDALETLILRWLRGSELAGLSALRARRGASPSIVRPLLPLRREEIRAALRRAGVAWREDSSNEDVRHARNAVRHVLLPSIVAACGARALEDLLAFERAVAGVDALLVASGRAVELGPKRHAAALRGADDVATGGTIARAALVALGRTPARRAIARLLADATRAIPKRAALDRIVDALFAGRGARLEVAGGWRVQVRADRIDVEPPRPRVAASSARRLAVPGGVDFDDGRRIAAVRVAATDGVALERGPTCVELDARGLSSELTVRAPRPGDRFRPLGAPGSKPLSRFLADAGVPRAERARVLLVTSGVEIGREEIVWVAGIRPSEAHRVGPATEARLRLELRTS